MEPLEIENEEKMRFLFLHLHSSIISFNSLLLCVTIINFFVLLFVTVAKMKCEVLADNE